MVRARAIAAPALWLLLACCAGGEEGPAAPPTGLTGRWDGAWASRDGVSRGALRLALTQDGTAIRGTAILRDSPCFSAGTVSATASGGAVKGTVTFGTLVVGFRATVEGDGMAGTYADRSGGPCTGDAGTIRATRS